MPTTTLKSAKLIKRTAWMQLRRIEKVERDISSPKEQHLARIAVRMLNFVACLNYAIDDLEADLRQSGRLCGTVARCFNISRRIVINAHSAAYKMLISIHNSVGRQYNSAMDEAWSRIDKCVLIPPPERGYNIVVALCRLVERLNRELGMRYYFEPARAIATIPAKLNGVGFIDYNLDNIIERATFV